MKRNGIKALGVPLLGALALFLASCGQQPPPSNGGGGKGGSTTPPTPPGPGVCVPKGDTSFSFTMKGEGGVIKSIQRTNQSGEDCFVKGTIRFSVSAPGAQSVKIVLATTNNFQAGQVVASGTDSASYDLNTASIPQGEVHYVIARVERNNTIRDQYWAIVADNLPPQLPDVRPVNKLNPDQPSNRWVNKTVELTLQNPDFRDNPFGPGLLASGVQKVIYKARRVDLQNAPELTIGEATAYPYKISWNTTQFADGRYHVYAVAEDAMGNVNRGPFSGFVVGVDNTAPTVELEVVDSGTLKVTDGLDIFPADQGFVSGEARYTYKATDAGVGISQVGLDWGAGARSLPPASTPTSGTIDVNDVQDGPTTFRLRARDLLGNESERTVTVTVDNNAPTLDNFLVNGHSPTPSLRVRAGDKATYAALAYDPTAGVKQVRFYYAAPGSFPWTDGHLFEIGSGTSALSQVVFPVLDPQNRKADDPDSDLYIIAMAVDRAGNAKAFYHTLKVSHTAKKRNGINGGEATLKSTPLGGGRTEYRVVSNAADPNDFTNVLSDGNHLYVAFYAQGLFDGAQKPVGMPAVVPTTPSVRRVVQFTETPPYAVVSTSTLNALLLNEYGHWAVLP